MQELIRRVWDVRMLAWEIFNTGLTPSDRYKAGQAYSQLADLHKMLTSADQVKHN